jgi:ubiquinone/menaquinone biosynthesis C-methylase UbiE
MNNGLRYIKEHHFVPLINRLTGRVLEVGFGKGENFINYLQAEEVYGIEKDSRKLSLANQVSIKNNIVNTSLRQGLAEQLPFEDNYFDSVVLLFVLCSCNSQQIALREIYRVLKPSGTLIALEHTVSHNLFFSTIQSIFSLPLAFFFNNCHLNSHPVRAIENNRFNILKQEYKPFFIEPSQFIIASKSV